MNDFALYLDPPAGSAGAAEFRRVIPLRDDGKVSLVYDDFGTPAPVTVKVRINGTPLSTLTLSGPGKTPVHKMNPGDTVAAFDVIPPTVGGVVIRPSIAALVEYN